MQTTTRNADYNRLMDAARERAGELRRQAIRDAWTGAEDALVRALRSARLFGHRLARLQAVRGNAARLAPRNRSTSAPQSAGTLSARHTTC